MRQAMRRHRSTFHPRPFGAALLRTNRQVYNESREIFYGHNEFFFWELEDLGNFFVTIGRDDAARVRTVGVEYGECYARLREEPEPEEWDAACAGLKLATGLELLKLCSFQFHGDEDWRWTARVIAEALGLWRRRLAATRAQGWPLREGSTSRPIEVHYVGEFSTAQYKEFCWEVARLESEEPGSQSSSRIRGKWTLIGTPITERRESLMYSANFFQIIDDGFYVCTVSYEVLRSTIIHLLVPFLYVYPHRNSISFVVHMQTLDAVKCC